MLEPRPGGKGGICGREVWGGAALLPRAAAPLFCVLE